MAIKVYTIYDYLRWRGIKLITIWAMIPIASCALFLKLVGDTLNDLSPILRIACVSLVVGVMFGGPVTFFVLMFRTACPRCRRALGWLAFLSQSDIVNNPTPRCPHCGVNIYEPMKTPANAK